MQTDLTRRYLCIYNTPVCTVYIHLDSIPAMGKRRGSIISLLVLDTYIGDMLGNTCISWSYLAFLVAERCSKAIVTSYLQTFWFDDLEPRKKDQKKKNMHLNWHDLASHFWCWKISGKKASTWEVTLQIIAQWCGANRPWLLGLLIQKITTKLWLRKVGVFCLREGAVFVGQLFQKVFWSGIFFA